MEIAPQIYNAKVMHKRLFPKVNQFTYGVYYLCLPESHKKDFNVGFWLGHNKRGLLAIYDKDHGARDGSDMFDWARGVLREYGMDASVKNIVLITMPRVLGYVFNPVSFWMCVDENDKLIVVLCEVHNTFGEQHTYVCAREDRKPISTDDWLEAEKLFHVSPFMERNGHYKFRFAWLEEQLGIWIDFYDKAQHKQLLTALSGKFIALSNRSLKSAFLSHPLVTIKTIALIHWQAVKLFSKGIRYVVKPEQLDGKQVSITQAYKNVRKW